MSLAELTRELEIILRPDVPAIRAQKETIGLANGERTGLVPSRNQVQRPTPYGNFAELRAWWGLGSTESMPANFFLPSHPFLQGEKLGPAKPHRTPRTASSIKPPRPKARLVAKLAVASKREASGKCEGRKPGREGVRGRAADGRVG